MRGGGGDPFGGLGGIFVGDLFFGLSRGWGFGGVVFNGLYVLLLFNGLVAFIFLIEGGDSVSPGYVFWFFEALCMERVVD